MEGYKDKQVEQQHNVAQVLKQMHLFHYTQEHHFKVSYYSD